MLKITEIRNVGKDVKEKKPSTLFMGMYIEQPLWKTMWRFLRKKNYQMIQQFHFCTQKKKNWKQDLNEISVNPMFTTHITTAKGRNNPIVYPQMNRRTKSMVHTYNRP